MTFSDTADADMSLYCIADLHLSEAVQKPMDIFGKNWAGYREKLIENWTGTVGENDTVVIPGDISWGMTLEEAIPDLKLISLLPGKKILIRGNHDFWWQSLTKIKGAFAEEGINNITLLQNNAVSAGECAICGSRGWWGDGKKAPDGVDSPKIVRREALRLEMSLKAGEALGTEKKVFLHFPPVYGEYICEPIMNVLHEHEVTQIYYGHLHNVPDIPSNKIYNGIKMTMVSADRLRFKPLKIDSEYGDKNGQL